MFLVTALGNLNDLDVGSDYMTDIMYVSIALFLLAQAVTRPASTVKVTLAVVFLGVALSSRVLYFVVIPPVLALTLQRTSTRRALVIIGGVLLTCAMVTLPVFLPHAFSLLRAQLNQNADKLRLLPRFLSGNTLPATALLLSSISFLIHMNLLRIFLLVGMATLVLVLPPMFFIIQAEGGFARPLTTDIEYFAVSAVFLAIWAMAAWEDIGLDPQKSRS